MSTKKDLIVNDANEVIGVKFTFGNGNELETYLSDYNEAMQYRLGVHGMSQKLGDSYANASGKGWTDDDIEATVRDLHAALMSGQFGTGRTGTGGKLLEAFIRWAADMGKGADEAREAFAAMDKKAKDELRKAAPIKAKLAEIEAERAEAAAKLASDTDDDEDLTEKYFG